MRPILAAGTILAIAVLATSAALAAPPRSSRPGGGFTEPVFGAKAAQYLYVYNAGSPGEITGEYARYSIPALQLQEMSIADGVGSSIAFGKHDRPVWVDEGSAEFAVFEMPQANGTQPGIEQFSGIPCATSSLSTDSKGDYYVAQYCSSTVLEYSPKIVKNGGTKNPIAVYSGGNFGSTGQPGPLTSVVDKKGNLYVGDYEGGVTYFPKGSTTGIIAFPTGAAGNVNEMVVDNKGDVWSIHGPNPTRTYFQNETTCIIDPSGSVIRFELAERFSQGTLVQQFYTATTDSPDTGGDGVSIAVDSKLRMYAGVENSTDSVVLDYDPGQSCPNDSLSIIGVHGSDPQIAIDDKRNFYVTDYIDNTLTAYTGGSTKVINQISQPTGLINIYYDAIK